MNLKYEFEFFGINCKVHFNPQELRRNDLQGLQHLQRLYAFGCSLEKVDPLYLDNLKILWLSGNRLTSLSVCNIIVIRTLIKFQISVTINLIPCLVCISSF